MFEEGQMPTRWKLPLSVREGWFGIQLVDAEGISVANAPTYNWGGPPIEGQKEIVRANLERLARLANRE